ncbi:MULTISPECIES: heme exporter protein CcmD [Sphingopyxis]|mgnify:CR=1 FL=1|uniref:heme exporter protein CcmD n=1 Tax=Sphingopyxis TaxID=165697 RepID=UPI00086DF14E|nr:MULTISPECIES: heme exporter protein CcmD [Sphingopyxis]APW73010.1 heme exporter protein CcmD [Sphingopyxis granuli]AVA13412.1 heme exporter protein CcmD [Sphingopyxis sp. MG]ODU34137.1 MAG: heme exporter protein CcmD [Sphingopyxis sp. SCN 67-31]QUM71571.1 heme exporter protein CcmD [Sphingopyxis granuli]UNK81190.1 heme exporter protein CcmD [Sphingopyxis granuli]
MTGVISGSGQWAYVVAAYALTALLIAAVLGHSWRAMRKAERRSDALRRDRT